MRNLRQSVLRHHSQASLTSTLPEDQARGRPVGPIRLGIVSHQRLIREALSALLSIEEGMGETALKPDVVLVDMPAGPEGIELIWAIPRENPDAKLLLLTAAGEKTPSF